MNIFSKLYVKFIAMSTVGKVSVIAVVVIMVGSIVFAVIMSKRKKAKIEAEKIRRMEALDEKLINKDKVIR